MNNYWSNQQIMEDVDSDCNRPSVYVAFKGCLRNVCMCKGIFLAVCGIVNIAEMTLN